MPSGSGMRISGSEHPDRRKHAGPDGTGGGSAAVPPTDSLRAFLAVAVRATLQYPGSTSTTVHDTESARASMIGRLLWPTAPTARR